MGDQINSPTCCGVDLKCFALIQAEFYHISHYKGKISLDIPKMHFSFKSFGITKIREQELWLLLTVPYNVSTCEKEATS